MADIFRQCLFYFIGMFLKMISLLIQLHFLKLFASSSLIITKQILKQSRMSKINLKTKIDSSICFAGIVINTVVSLLWAVVTAKHIILNA